MKTTTHPFASAELADRFYRTAKNFQASIARIAMIADKTPVEVFTLWRKYSDDCSNFDQSSILGEFIEWYCADLGDNPEALRSAIQ